MNVYELFLAVPGHKTGLTLSYIWVVELDQNDANLNKPSHHWCCPSCMLCIFTFVSIAAYCILLIYYIYILYYIVCS